MAEELKPLVGDVQTVMTYQPARTSFAHAVEAVRLDQEAMAGYPLVMTKERHSHKQLGQDGIEFYEVVVTFSPKEPSPADSCPPPPAQETVQMEVTDLNGTRYQNAVVESASKGHV